MVVAQAISVDSEPRYRSLISVKASHAGETVCLAKRQVNFAGHGTGGAGEARRALQCRTPLASTCPALECWVLVVRATELLWPRCRDRSSTHPAAEDRRGSRRRDRSWFH